MTGNIYKPSPAAWRVGGKIISSAQLAWTGYVIVVALYAVVLSQCQIELVPGQVHLLGIGIAALCLFPITLWMARGSRTIPGFELICLAYLMAFSTPLYLQKNQIIIFSQPLTFTWDEIYRTLLLSALGITAFIVGYYTVAESKASFRSLQLDLPMHPRKRLTFIKMAFSVGLVLVALRGAGIDLGAGVFNSFVNLTQNLVNVAIVLLGYRVLRGQESKGWALVLYSAVALATVFGLMTGMLENAILPVLLLVIVRWNVLRRVPVALLAVGLCAFVVLNSVKMSYRAQTWGSSTDVGAAERLGLWMDLLQGTKGIAQGSGYSFQDAFHQSMSRFDLLHSFARVQQLTPASVPYYEGKTYSYLFYGWVPRFIWPDKPTAQESNVTFALDYRFLAEEQTSTTMTGIGHLPEAYANFGVWGVAVVMALQGMFLATVGKMLNGPFSDGSKGIYLSAMITFLNGIGSSTSALFMSIPLIIVVTGMVLRFFATGWRATSAPR